MMRRVVASLACVTAIASPAAAAAQTAAAAPRIELGLVVSEFVENGPIGLGGRVGVAATACLAIEAEGAWTDAMREHRSVRHMTWFYAWQVKHTLRQERSGSVFATYGAAGWVDHGEERRNGEAAAARVRPPLVPVGGFGAQRAIGRRAVIRGDAQVLVRPFSDGFVAARLSGGMVIPVGGYPAFRRRENRC